MKKLSYIKLAMIVFFALFALGGKAMADDKSIQEYIPVMWDQLIPRDYNLEELENQIVSKYDLNTLTDDSVEGQALLAELQQLSDKAPVVMEYDAINVKIPGFVVPLDFADEKINSFLLVPYYGACIHTPPPPSNQIIYVEVQKGFKLDNLYDPVYVSGMMMVERAESDLGTAGYKMAGKRIESYY